MTTYDPPRQTNPKPTGEPLEIDLVYNVRPCGTCSFFWPPDPSTQPYGPYPTYDFLTNEPGHPDPNNGVEQFKWVKGKTQDEAFPDPEIMDGCRKAPIMTIGINPNLTAFAPGQMGTKWCYPHFTDDDKTDQWTKYAYYYRYRSVYQECFDLKWIEQFLLPDDRIVASKAGYVTSAQRPTDAPGYSITVRYDGDKTDTTIALNRDLGTPRWVLLYDAHGPNNRFNAGDTIAARLNVPAGKLTEVFRDQIGYYEQFVPTLDHFQDTIRADGHKDATLRMGEDVCQLDMVACASPHWNPGFLGGTSESEHTVIDNCVVKNAWAMKQFVQTRPAILYLVGESSWDMFRDSFGALVRRKPALSSKPPDGAFTLLRETTGLETPTYIEFSTKIDGQKYSVKTRLVITPHFSYNSNFALQWRLSPKDWQWMQEKEAAVATLLQSDKRIAYQPASSGNYASFTVQSQADVDALNAQIKSMSRAAAKLLAVNYYDAHAMMANVLDEMYKKGELTYGRVGNIEALTRTEGACKFCVNERWKFPLGCPYGKPDEPQPPVGWLQKVAAALVAAGQPKSTSTKGKTS
jgi:hypothetical protein